MNKKILITDLTILGKKVRLSCLTTDRRLLEARCQRMEETGILGNIYVGRVQRIVKNIRAAFIEIAPGRACYYPMEGERSPVFVRKIPSPELVQGDELLVQVEKEDVKTKAPTVTTNLSFSGRYVVLTSEKKQIGFSSRLPGEVKNHFRELLQGHNPGEFGLIVRTNAKTASDQEFLDEVRELSERMRELIRKAGMRTCFSCVFQSPEKYISYLRSCDQQEVSEIVTDLPEVFDQVRDFQKSYPGLEQVALRFYEDPLLPLAKLYNLERQMEGALEKRVWLKSGGYLVIEPTEAMTVIDVNTGKSTAKKDPARHFLNTNLEAAEEIARQLRLRNISGIILIDFIDLASGKDRQTVMEALRRAVREDPVPVQVVDMTKLNLVELTRKKVEKSLAEQLG